MNRVRVFGDNLIYLLCLSLSFSLASHLSVPFWYHFVTHFFSYFPPVRLTSLNSNLLYCNNIDHFLFLRLLLLQDHILYALFSTIWPSVALAGSFLRHYFCHFIWLSLFGFPFHLNPFFCFLASSFLSATLYHPLSCSLSSSCSTYHCISVLTRSASPSVLPRRKALWNELIQMAFYGSAQHNQAEHSRQS